MSCFRRTIFILSQLLIILNSLHSECVNPLFNGYQGKFLPSLKTSSLFFVNSPYYGTRAVNLSHNYDVNKYNVARQDESPTHFSRLSLAAPGKSNTATNAPTRKNLVLSASSNLKSKVDRFVKKVSESRGYRLVSVGLNKVKNYMSNLSFFEQVGLLFFGNFVYSFFLSQYHIVFPFQLIPTDSSLGINVGLDTLVSLGFLYYLFKDFKFPEKYFSMPKMSLLKTSMVLSSLFGSFLASGVVAGLVNEVMFLMSALGYPVSMAMVFSLTVITGHIFWVTVGSLIIHKAVFPIFGKENPWYKLNLKKTWVYQVLSGYISSFAVYRFSDIVSLALFKFLKIDKDLSATEQLVSNVCEMNEVLPIFLTSIGPCLTAPWWEEILYRVLVFKMLNSFMPSLLSSVLSSSLFALNHLRMDSFIQLFTIGLLWSLIHTKEDNIWVNFLIHSLWNSRILFSSITGI